MPEAIQGKQTDNNDYLQDVMRVRVRRQDAGESERSLRSARAELSDCSYLTAIGNLARQPCK